MREDGEMTGRRPHLAAAPETPLDNEDILDQILLRLLPRPSSLPRSSLVCKRWRRLVSDPGFLRRFRAHHRKVPLLGYFAHDYQCGNICFVPALDPPDRIPTALFSLPINKRSNITGCRHGRVLVINRNRKFLVWDPVIGAQRQVYFPMAFRGDKYMSNGAVMCAAGDPGHVHGCCHSSPFQVVMLGHGAERLLACVYSSETDAWGNPISIMLPQNSMVVSADCPKNTLVGNSICWLLTGENVAILEFDLGRQSLALIEAPQDPYYNTFDSDDYQLMITPAEGGGLGFLALLGFNIWLWKRKTDSDGVVGWVLKNTIELSSVILPRPCVGRSPPAILGLAEDDNVMFLLIDGDGIFMINLDSTQFKKLPVDRSMYLHTCHPFTSFYPSGIYI
ncbi:uncharacterized protein LOC133902859 isoform X2 [Phragmites australis]|uniref:uncharacterized protein LOC133902859 isoform X2 n=1 Tax=Phragmites australis TaxID=29695 RepID=UPI002D7A1ACF|nr:uncharacterized protein LOC133902859 isoform X2 [Phragmites australis]